MRGSELLVSPQRWQEWISAYGDAWSRTASDQDKANAALPEPGHLQRPLGSAAIDEAEARLGVQFPPSLRSFYEVTNGLLELGPPGGRIEGVHQLQWLREVDLNYRAAAADVAYDETTRALLGRALRVGVPKRGSWLLDPAGSESGEWTAYIWRPVDHALERFDSFGHLLTHLRDELERYRSGGDAPGAESDSEWLTVHEIGSFPRDVGQWHHFVSEWSRDLLASPVQTYEVWHPDGVTEKSRFTDAQRTDLWLGATPCTEAKILEHESRLGRRLPTSYRNFLLVSNGWDVTGLTELYSLENAGWCGDSVPWLVDAWAEFEHVAPRLGSALVVGEGGDGGYLLLEPRDSDRHSDRGDEWPAYYFWAGDGGELDRYRSFGAFLLEYRHDSDAAEADDG